MLGTMIYHVPLVTSVGDNMLSLYGHINGALVSLCDVVLSISLFVACLKQLLYTDFNPLSAVKTDHILLSPAQCSDDIIVLMTCPCCSSRLLCVLFTL